MPDLPALLDANVWIALAFAAHPHHAIAVNAFRPLSAARPAVFCRATQQSFLRLASTPAILRLCNASSLTNRDALMTLDGFMSSPAVTYQDEPGGAASLWHRFGGIPSASPHVWMDAYLAAFAVAGGLELITFDRGFSKFAGLTYTVLS